MASWVKVHQQLWPETEIPELLNPTAASTKSSDVDMESRYFVESTLPTSMMISALCSQVIQGRSAKRFRNAASVLLHGVLKKLVRSGKMKLSLSSDGIAFDVPVSSTGAFPSSPLIVSLGRPDQRRVRQHWNEDEQDWNTKNMLFVNLFLIL